SSKVRDQRFMPSPPCRRTPARSYRRAAQSRPDMNVRCFSLSLPPCARAIVVMAARPVRPKPAVRSRSGLLEEADDLAHVVERLAVGRDLRHGALGVAGQ